MCGGGEQLKAGTDLIEAWKANPQAEAAVIVHVEGSPAQYTAGRVFRLTRTVSARGLAHSVLELLQEPWVQKVELDQTITTMN